GRVLLGERRDVRRDRGVRGHPGVAAEPGADGDRRTLHRVRDGALAGRGGAADATAQPGGARTDGGQAGRGVGHGSRRRPGAALAEPRRARGEGRTTAIRGRALRVGHEAAYEISGRTGYSEPKLRTDGGTSVPGGSDGSGFGGNHVRAAGTTPAQMGSSRSSSLSSGPPVRTFAEASSRGSANRSVCVSSASLGSRASDHLPGRTCSAIARRPASFSSGSSTARAEPRTSTDR